MNEKKFVVVRTSSSHTLTDYRLFISDSIEHNGFSSQIEKAMKLEISQAVAVKKALESVESIHSKNFYEEGIKVSYSVEEIQR